jgi:hypothetical protein
MGRHPKTFTFANIALDGGLVGFGADSGLSRSRAKPDSG